MYFSIAILKYAIAQVVISGLVTINGVVDISPAATVTHSNSLVTVCGSANNGSPWNGEVVGNNIYCYEEDPFGHFSKP